MNFLLSNSFLPQNGSWMPIFVLSSNQWTGIIVSSHPSHIIYRGTCTCNVQFQKISIPPPQGRFFHFNPPSTRNFRSRGVCEDPPSPLEFPFFLYPHFRTPRKFQVVLNVENWRLTEVQSILFITLLRYLRFILLLMYVEKNLNNAWFLPAILINLKYSKRRLLLRSLNAWFPRVLNTLDHVTKTVTIYNYL